MAHIETKTTITLTETTQCVRESDGRLVPLPRGHILKDGWHIATAEEIAKKAAEEAERKAAERKAADEAAAALAPETSPSSTPSPEAEPVGDLTPPGPGWAQ